MKHLIFTLIFICSLFQALQAQEKPLPNSPVQGRIATNFDSSADLNYALSLSSVAMQSKIVVTADEEATRFNLNFENTYFRLGSASSNGLLAFEDNPTSLASKMLPISMVTDAVTRLDSSLQSKTSTFNLNYAGFNFFVLNKSSEAGLLFKYNTIGAGLGSAEEPQFEAGLSSATSAGLSYSYTFSNGALGLALSRSQRDPSSTDTAWTLTRPANYNQESYNLIVQRNYQNVNTESGTALALSYTEEAGLGLASRLEIATKVTALDLKLYTSFVSSNYKNLWAEDADNSSSLALLSSLDLSRGALLYTNVKFNSDKFADLFFLSSTDTLSTKEIQSAQNYFSTSYTVGYNFPLGEHQDTLKLNATLEAKTDDSLGFTGQASLSQIIATVYKKMNVEYEVTHSESAGMVPQLSLEFSQNITPTKTGRFKIEADTKLQTKLWPNLTPATSIWNEAPSSIKTSTGALASFFLRLRYEQSSTAQWSFSLGWADLELRPLLQSEIEQSLVCKIAYQAKL